MKPFKTTTLMFATVACGLNIPHSRLHSELSSRDAEPGWPDFTYEPIKTGYVAFGDSYAAGIGAGSTSWGGCRVGENSYPNQLKRWVSNLQPGVSYQDFTCSGAKITHLLSAGGDIARWTNPSMTDRATLSIGGNDVGFYNVLTSCVLRVGGDEAGDCDYYIREAMQLMYGAVFNYNVDDALRQIIHKSGREDFRIIWTGYPTFFNDQTSDCDNTTFYFWAPGHHDSRLERPEDGDWAYLSRYRRTQLNTLVEALNTRLKTIADELNEEFTQPSILFADPNPYYDGHRFCEDKAREPNPDNINTWLFLASCPDVALPGGTSVAGPMADEPALKDLSIPDAITCASTSYWNELMLCEMARAGIIYDDGQGLTFVPTVQLPDGTDVSTSEIPWWKPTDYVKTFHPRSPGHLAYRQLVKDTW